MLQQLLIFLRRIKNMLWNVWRRDLIIIFVLSISVAPHLIILGRVKSEPYGLPNKVCNSTVALGILIAFIINSSYLILASNYGNRRRAYLRSPLILSEQGLKVNSYRGFFAIASFFAFVVALVYFLSWSHLYYLSSRELIIILLSLVLMVTHFVNLYNTALTLYSFPESRGVVPDEGSEYKHLESATRVVETNLNYVLVLLAAGIFAILTLHQDRPFPGIDATLILTSLSMFYVILTYPYYMVSSPHDISYFRRLHCFKAIFANSAISSALLAFLNAILYEKVFVLSSPC